MEDVRAFVEVAGEKNRNSNLQLKFRRIEPAPSDRSHPELQRCDDKIKANHRDQLN